MNQHPSKHLLGTFVAVGLAAGLTVGVSAAPTVAAGPASSVGSAGSADSGPASAARGGDCAAERKAALVRSNQVDKKERRLAQARKRVNAALMALDHARTPRQVRVARERLAAAESLKARAKEALKHARVKEKAALRAYEECLAG